MWFERLLFPRRCVSCRKYWGAYVCERCFAGIPFCKIQYCSRLECSKPALHGATHPKCVRKNGLDGHISITEYAGIMKHVLEFYKRRGVYQLEEQIRLMMELYLYVDEESVFSELNAPIVMTVPLFKYDAWFRSYCVARRLGEIFAGYMGFVFDATVLVKQIPTLPQKDLSRTDRLINMSGVFSVREKEKVIGCDIILVDDVWTTGATLRECAKVLKMAGAKTVWAVTLCRGV